MRLYLQTHNISSPVEVSLVDALSVCTSAEGLARDVLAGAHLLNLHHRDSKHQRESLARGIGNTMRTSTFSHSIELKALGLSKLEPSNIHIGGSYLTSFGAADFRL